MIVFHLLVKNTIKFCGTNVSIIQAFSQSHVLFLLPCSLFLHLKNEISSQNEKHLKGYFKNQNLLIAAIEAKNSSAKIQLTRSLSAWSLASFSWSLDFS
ncbi:hypothetical protein CDL12_10812 [Handroanthus impetiginosus]|uniref:Uncharacterized protein n=1 Tax=Handroanthus impetiginosus TaxID=429701 RepID=A0A2G9HG96_9LAMI|nr:hypothetical protein CDL12_10812 [Handroanthus impetiginosus]